MFIYSQVHDYMYLLATKRQTRREASKVKSLNFQPGKTTSWDQENLENPKSWQGKPGKNDVRRLGSLIHTLLFHMLRSCNERDEMFYYIRSVDK